MEELEGGADGWVGTKLAYDVDEASGDGFKGEKLNPKVSDAASGSSGPDIDATGEVSAADAVGRDTGFVGDPVGTEKAVRAYEGREFAQSPPLGISLDDDDEIKLRTECLDKARKDLGPGSCAAEIAEQAGGYLDFLLGLELAIKTDIE